VKIHVLRACVRCEACCTALLLCCAMHKTTTTCNAANPTRHATHSALQRHQNSNKRFVLANVRMRPQFKQTHCNPSPQSAAPHSCRCQMHANKQYATHTLPKPARARSPKPELIAADRILFSAAASNSRDRLQKAASAELARISEGICMLMSCALLCIGHLRWLHGACCGVLHGFSRVECCEWWQGVACAVW
jgi:hypothetical protein